MAKRRPKSRAKATKSASAANVQRPIHRKWPEGWQRLIDANGGTADSLGKILGVSGMTIGRWADGLVEPSEPTKRLVNSMAALHGIKPLF